MVKEGPKGWTRGGRPCGARHLGRSGRGETGRWASFPRPTRVSLLAQLETPSPGVPYFSPF